MSAQHVEGSRDTARAEAQAHFERGVTLMGHENWEAALVEFTRSLELYPTRSALFNGAMCHKALYRYGPAALLFRRWLTEYGDAAPAEERERVEAAYAEVRSLLGNLSVSVSLDGAEVRVDGRGVGRSPLPGPLELSVGPHVVEAVLDGYRTARQEATVVAGQDAVTVLTLVPGPPEPTQDTAGTLVVRTVVPEARVEIDGAPADLAERVAAGRRRVRVTRPGFEPFETEVVVEPGGTVEVEATLALAAALEPDASGFLRVTVDGEAGDVRLNGAPLPQLATTGLVVPAGPHVVEVLREGYLPWRRRVEVAAGAHETLRALPWPTPETLEAYERDARAWSIAGWSTLGAGVALAGGGGGLLGWGVSLDDDLQAGIADWCTRVGADSDCDPWGDQSRFTIYSGGYEDRDRLQSDRDRALGVEIGGWVLVGLGAAAVVTGTVLLLTGDDPDYYREQAEPGVSTAGLAPCAGGAVLTLGGRF
ncbi:MAG: PEGA domain-containing protein [Myxococcales bacterium]|nr:PEGA domain-containing protein [Myxococcales bacterium]